METDYASPERDSNKEILKQRAKFQNSELLAPFFQSSPNCILVLNSHRQIIVANEYATKIFNVNKLEEILGLRYGEAFHCVYSCKKAAGCGTTAQCKSCGALRAVLTAQEFNKTTIDFCALQVSGDANAQYLAFEITATPAILQNDKYIILILRDTREERLRIALEKSFFHDLNNVMTALTLTSYVLKDEPNNETLEDISHLAERASREIEVQRALLYASSGKYKLHIESIQISKILDECKLLIHRLPQSNGKQCDILSEIDSELEIQTDYTLILRILTNMIKNGLESSSYDKPLKVSIQKKEDNLIFQVWNDIPIPTDIQPRIFQEFFSTKEGNYRGLGTYSMRLFTEELLKGKIWFTSNSTDGTNFFLQLPLKYQS